MRKLIAVVALSAIGVSVADVAHAQTWKATPQPIAERSPTTCANMQLPSTPTVYTFTLEGNTLSGESTNRAKFTLSVAADGAVKGTFTAVTTQSAVYTLELSGNAKSKDLEIYHTRLFCRAKLVPVQ